MEPVPLHTSVFEARTVFAKYCFPRSAKIPSFLPWMVFPPGAFFILSGRFFLLSFWEFSMIFPLAVGFFFSRSYGTATSLAVIDSVVHRFPGF